jgi:hypothetical protein
MSKRLIFRWRDAMCDSELAPTTRFVLAFLSFDADEDGGSCFPSTRRLAKRTGLSRRVVMEHLQDAEVVGWIRRHPIGTDRGQGWKRHRYELCIPPKVVTEGDHEGGYGESPRSSAPLSEGGNSGARRGHPKRTNVVTEGDHTSPVTSQKTSQTPPEGAADAAAPEGEAVEGEVVEEDREAATTDSDRMDTQELVAAWITRRGERPPSAAIVKQGAAAKKLASLYSRVDLERALDGIGRLYPHSNGAPWDLFDLEKKFVNALAAPTTTANGGRRGRPAEYDPTDTWE